MPNVLFQTADLASTPATFTCAAGSLLIAVIMDGTTDSPMTGVAEAGWSSAVSRTAGALHSASFILQYSDGTETTFTPTGGDSATPNDWMVLIVEFPTATTTEDFGGDGNLDISTNDFINLGGHDGYTGLYVGIADSDATMDGGGDGTDLITPINLNEGGNKNLVAYIQTISDPDDDGWLAPKVSASTVYALGIYFLASPAVVPASPGYDPVKFPLRMRTHHLPYDLNKGAIRAR